MHSSSRSGARVVGAEIVAVSRGDAAYPERFHELTRPPEIIYTRGTFAIAAPPAVAIVGTRHATPYGMRVARALATACARAGACVVSGLARGIDGAAHEAALTAGGRTVAVLGTGPDLFYPRGHRWLQERIADEGLLISEHPPGSSGHAGAFPLRNRLIAALADITIVVEAGADSGALITARHAHDLQRHVGVVPNAIDVPAAIGSNALLREAHVFPVLTADDVLARLAMEPLPPHLPALTGDAASVWDALQQGACEVADVARIAQLSLSAAQGALGLLEIDGMVHFDAAGRVRPAVC